MKKNKHSQHVEVKPLKTSASATAKMSNPVELRFTPSPRDVAHRAHCAYVDGGSQPGQDVQNWLDAENHLIAEHLQAHGHGQHAQV